MQNERLQLMCKKLADIQVECIKEGYLLDVPSRDIQGEPIYYLHHNNITVMVYNIAQATKQLSEWSKYPMVYMRSCM